MQANDCQCREGGWVVVGPIIPWIVVMIGRGRSQYIHRSYSYITDFNKLNNLNEEYRKRLRYQQIIKLLAKQYPGEAVYIFIWKHTVTQSREELLELAVELSCLIL